jgi:hypothetical protein
MSVVIDGSNGVTTNIGAVYNGLQTGTAQASTSGTSITFSSIPSWVKRVTVMFNGVNTSGSSGIFIQVGSGSTSITGYSSVASRTSTAATVTTSTIGAYIYHTGTSDFLSGSATILTTGSNNWSINYMFGGSSAGASYFGAASTPTLSGALDRVVISTYNGTDTFTAGSINILYE